MADTVNALVSSDNENGTQSAEWTSVEQIDPDQKVLLGRLNPLSGTMEATWAPSSGAAVFKEKTITESGIYDPQQEGADGYSMVTVDIPTPVERMARLTSSDFAEGAEVYIYNNDSGNTILTGTFRPSSTVSTITMSYPDTFTPAKTTFSGVKGIYIQDNPSSTNGPYSLVNDKIVMNTSDKTITITLYGSSFDSTFTTYLQLWAE